MCRLIEGDGFHLAYGFERVASLNQEAAACADGQTRGNRGRGGQYQRAGASDQQQRQAAIEPRIYWVGDKHHGEFKEKIDRGEWYGWCLQNMINLRLP